ncbi:TniQ family protein [Rhodoferax sp. BAB1]|uniref:TniQ family protein n=1 Tax=Rhodoferax sp. BAB1 TaxID=2741720 RepID=UPI00157606B2|nr:TniQ family protein [Rhodoferax sp. BAB1]QKO20585.1 TniQ family protein [Rhodoferax sp. BAB1]
MLRIPYVPTAYPDETFGSLLTRLVLYNGTGLWRSLLEDSGYGRRTISPFYSMPVRDTRIDSLLSALGYSYQDMLRQLTSLPFWLAFNNATPLRHRIALPSDDGTGTRLFLVGKAYASVGARFCPACLVDDFDAFGEPYLHRHHQLPVALVCAKHGEWLRMTCKACGITVLPFNKTLLRSPALRCDCGKDLTTGSGPPCMRRQRLQRLSQFAESTLSCTSAPWTHSQIRTILQTKNNFKKSNFLSASLKLLERTYGPMERSPSGLEISFKPNAAEDIHLRLKVPASLQRAPEFCALLSATGLSFEEFRTAAKSALVTPISARVRPAPRPTTLAQARFEFNYFYEKSPGSAASKLQQKAPELYWLLRLKDSSWLEQRIQRSLWTIPSIEQDRARLWRALKVEHLSYHNMRRAGPLVRATIRDAIWLRDKLMRLQPKNVVDISAADIAQRNRAIALSRALFSVLRAEQKPLRIHAGLLSRFAKISMTQAQIAIANCPPLRHLIDAVNAGKNRRTAMWAARTLADAGHHPSASEVLLKAGLNTTKVNRDLALEAIASRIALRN